MFLPVYIILQQLSCFLSDLAYVYLKFYHVENNMKYILKYPSPAIF